MKKCWNWARDGDERVLYLDGVIAEETWFGDEVSPAAFRAELHAEAGPVTVYINSPGGCCVAASQIYTMLMEYPSDVTVKIDGLAASAASVIAMAGTTVLMAPTALMMMHRPLTVAMGNTDDNHQRKHRDHQREGRDRNRMDYDHHGDQNRVDYIFKHGHHVLEYHHHQRKNRCHQRAIQHPNRMDNDHDGDPNRVDYVFEYGNYVLEYDHHQR